MFVCRSQTILVALCLFVWLLCVLYFGGGAGTGKLPGIFIDQLVRKFGGIFVNLFKSTSFNMKACLYTQVSDSNAFQSILFFACSNDTVQSIIY